MLFLLKKLNCVYLEGNECKVRQAKWNGSNVAIKTRKKGKEENAHLHHEVSLFRLFYHSSVGFYTYAFVKTTLCKCTFAYLSSFGNF